MGSRAAIYTRISRDATGEHLGVQRQEEECRRFARVRGFDVVEVVSDNSISAFAGKVRPGFERLLDLAREGQVDVIVAYAVDRMARDLMDWVRIDELATRHAVPLITAIGDADLTNPAGRMMAGMMALMARQESERKGERQRLANRQAAEAGQWWGAGTAPFGYDAEGRPVPAEADAIRSAAQRVLSGVPLVAIAESWCEAGFRSANAREGRPGWTPRGVRGVLTNPRHAGLRVLNGETFMGQWEAILSMDEHEALVSKLTAPSRRLGDVQTGRRPSTLLTGILECGRCHGTARGSRSRGELIYACGRCHGVFLRRAETDAWVEGWMIAFLSRPENVAHLLATDDGEAEAAREEAQAVTERMARNEEDYADDRIDYGAYRRIAQRLEARLEVAQDKLARSAGSIALADFLAPLKGGKVQEMWKGLPLDDRRALIQRTVRVVAPEPTGRRPPQGVVRERLVEIVRKTPDDTD